MLLTSRATQRESQETPGEPPLASQTRPSEAAPKGLESRGPNWHHFWHSFARCEVFYLSPTTLRVTPVLEDLIYCWGTRFLPYAHVPASTHAQTHASALRRSSPRPPSKISLGEPINAGSDNRWTHLRRINYSSFPCDRQVKGAFLVLNGAFKIMRTWSRRFFSFLFLKWWGSSMKNWYYSIWRLSNISSLGERRRRCSTFAGYYHYYYH